MHRINGEHIIGLQETETIKRRPKDPQRAAPEADSYSYEDPERTAPEEEIYEAEPVVVDSYEATEPLYEAAPEDPRQSAPGGATGNTAEAMFDYQAGERNCEMSYYIIYIMGPSKRVLRF